MGAMKDTDLCEINISPLRLDMMFETLRVKVSGRGGERVVKFVTGLNDLTSSERRLLEVMSDKLKLEPKTGRVYIEVPEEG